MTEPHAAAAPGKILTAAQDREIKRINSLPLGQRIEELSRIQRVQNAPASAMANDEEMAKVYGIHFKQQAEAVRSLLGHWVHPLVEAKSLEHYRHQINTMVVLLAESAGRWGVEFDAVTAAMRPIYDVEAAKRADREAASKVQPAPELVKLSSPESGENSHDAPGQTDLPSPAEVADSAGAVV